MFDEVFPYIWIHLMDVQKVSTKTRVETHSSWQIHGRRPKICRRQWRPWSNCWIQTLELLRLSGMGDGKVETGIFTYTHLKNQKSTIEM